MFKWHLEYFFACLSDIFLHTRRVVQVIACSTEDREVTGRVCASLIFPGAVCWLHTNLGVK